MTNIAKTEIVARAESAKAEFENTVAQMTSPRSQFALMKHAETCFTKAYNAYYTIMDDYCNTEQEEAHCVEQMDNLYAVAQKHNIETLALGI